MSRRQGWVQASLGGFATRAAEVAIKLALYMLAARYMGDQECGVMFLCLSWAMLAGTASRLGIERALSRLIAAELALGQGRSARLALQRGALAVTVVGLTTGAITLAAAPFSAKVLFHSAAALPALRATAMIIPALTLAVTVGFALVGFGRTVLSQIQQNLIWPVGLLSGLLLGGRHASDLLLIMAACQGLAILVALAAIIIDRGRLKNDQPLPASAPSLPSLWRSAKPLYIVELVQVSINAVPVLLLGVFADPGAVSLFSISLRASMLVLVVLLSLSIVASPRFAALHRQGDWDRLAILNRRTQAVGLMLGGLIAAFLAVAGPFMLGLIGRDFARGMPALVILLVGQLVNALYTGQDSLLAMTGQGVALRALNLGQLLMMLLLSLALIPLFGMVGAAIVTAVVTAQGAIGTALAVRVLYPQIAPRLVPGIPARLARMMSGLKV